MSRSLSWGRRLVLSGALAAWLAACSLEAEVPQRNDSAAPINTSVTWNGAGAAADGDAGLGSGSATRISNIDNGQTSHRASAGGRSGSAGTGGTHSASSADNGGSTSSDAGAAASAGAAGADSQEPPTLWFSEYIEGSSSNKALEITALARSVLDGCKVSTYFNGKTEATVVATLSGVLEADRALTLCTSSLHEALAATCNQVGNLTFNGDDAVALSCNGIILDVIGQIGVDPGTTWGSDANTTLDRTLRRKCTVQTGDADGSDAFDPSVQWQAFPIDTFDGLGTRGCAGVL